MPRKNAEVVDVRYDRIKIDEPHRKAILFQIGGKEYWLPRSLIEVNTDAKTVTMPAWKAEQDELDGEVI